MAESKQYVVGGGVEGRERLRILARVMHDTTSSLFDALGVAGGLACLDVGCGGGDVTRELARRVAPRGRAVGTEIDPSKLDSARQEARQQGVANAEFRLSDVHEPPAEAEFDVVYARFLLTHLHDPPMTVGALRRHVKPGGRLVLEDIDFSGGFTYPASKAYQRYADLYCEVVRRRGGDPCIGPRLPLLLKEAGFLDVAARVVQPIGTEGDVKMINALTMENIAGTVMEDGLASRREIDETVRELCEFAADPRTVAGLPRVIQAWGRRPAE